MTRDAHPPLPLPRAGAPSSASADLADLAWGPMGAGKAAAFLEVSDEQFRHLAPSLPRHKRPGIGYRYLRSELLMWLRGELDEPLPEADNLPQLRQPDGNAGSRGLTDSRKSGPKQRVMRLV